MKIKWFYFQNKKDKHPLVKDKSLTESQINLIYEDYQKADRLVYCNLLEHLMLHIKIVENPKPLIKKILVGEGGINNFLIPELNDIYSGINYQIPWKQSIVKVIVGFEEDYLKIIDYMFKNTRINIKEIRK
ncbi:MAG: hypothetical protein K4H23_04950 [Mollicutes bacterium PWAP]|nr:hypothetical protein [Mollicutes bacterium PWAP]